MYFCSNEAQVQFDHSQVTLDNMDHQVLFDLALFTIKAKEGYLEITLKRFTISYL